MATTPTRSDIFAAGRRFVTIRPSGIRREMVDTPGSTIRALLGAGATMTEEVAIFASQAYNETRLGTAAKVGGDVLDRAIFDRFGRDIEPRRSASVARVYLSFSRPAIGVGFTLAAGFRCATGDSAGGSFAQATRVRTAGHGHGEGHGHQRRRSGDVAVSDRRAG